MLSVSICALIVLGFMALVFLSGKVEPSAKTEKVTEGMRKMLLFVPAMVIAIFAVLFCTVLKGRLIERSSHALIVLSLWLYGAAFYVNVLKFFKSRSILLFSIIGMIASVAMAIFLTPLDRYCVAMFSAIHEITFVLGGIMLALWYLVQAKIYSPKH